MAKKLNGVFRAWVCVKQADQTAPSIIWGDCIVHFSNPEFSGNILHTSAMLEVTSHKSLKVVETRNHLYILLGPELSMPDTPGIDPAELLSLQRANAPKSDPHVSAAMNADRDCTKCKGAGVYRRDEHHLAICDLCCKHNQGWWRLEGAYGVDNGRWACKAGCGVIVDTPPLELEFLPRSVS